MTTPPQVDANKLTAAVSGIWEKFRGVTLDRVTTLEEAAVALLSGPMDPERRRHAEREAHKLAGSVGTFGFARGSEIAREIELLLAGTNLLDISDTLRLTELAVSLRGELEAPTDAAAAAPERPIHLLVVDRDEGFTARVVMEAEGRGLIVRVATLMSDIRAALADGGHDVVLLDMAALENTELGLWLLTEMTRRAPTRPVLVASQESDFHSRMEAARLGARTFLQKPIPPAAVINAVMQAVQRSELSAHVMTVDDNPLTLATVRAVLETTGLRVTTVEDPRTFWDELESGRPDLVILDVDMPYATGLDLCRVIRNEGRWATLPVIFLTARTDAGTIGEIFAAGADDYVAKPVVGPELITRVENRLERVRLYRELADTDALTGVGNRRKSEENIKRLLGLAARQKLPFSLAVIDLDHFKTINDRFGHAMGDDVLRRVSKRLTAALRGEDVIGRWGGEEFVIGAFGVDRLVLQKRLTDALDAIRSDGFMGEVESFSLTFSGGIAEFPRDGSDLPALYRAADALLYDAKSQGRGRVVSAGASGPEREAVEDFDVVIVDDDPVLAELLLHTLSTHGYRTRWLGDGESLLAALSGRTPSLKARVVLLDVNLPGRNGLGVLQELARTGALQQTRVIMLTVRAMEAEVVRSLELGAFDHVAKPFSVPVLLRRIHNALQTG